MPHLSGMQAMDLLTLGQQAMDLLLKYIFVCRRTWVSIGKVIFMYVRWCCCCCCHSSWSLFVPWRLTSFIEHVNKNSNAESLLGRNINIETFLLSWRLQNGPFLTLYLPHRASILVSFLGNPRYNNLSTAVLHDLEALLTERVALSANPSKDHQNSGEMTASPASV